MKRILVILFSMFLFFSCQEDFERIVECQYSVRIINHTDCTFDVRVGGCNFDSVIPSQITEYKTGVFTYDEKEKTIGYVKNFSVLIGETGVVSPTKRGEVTFICDQPRKYTITIDYDIYNGIDKCIFFISEVL